MNTARGSWPRIKLIIISQTTWFSSPSSSTSTIKKVFSISFLIKSCILKRRSQIINETNARIEKSNSSDYILSPRFIFSQKHVEFLRIFLYCIIIAFYKFNISERGDFHNINIGFIYIYISRTLVHKYFCPFCNR